MISYKQTVDRDLVIENGDLAIVEDGDAVIQLVKQRLLFHKGEWDYDTDAGIDWIDSVYQLPFNPIIAESLIKTEILETTGIDRLLDFQMDVDANNKRVIDITFTASTIFSDAQFTESL